jgi:hypothetical protein
LPVGTAVQAGLGQRAGVDLGPGRAVSRAVQDRLDRIRDLFGRAAAGRTHSASCWSPASSPWSPPSWR